MHSLQGASVRVSSFRWRSVFLGVLAVAFSAVSGAAQADIDGDFLARISNENPQLPAVALKKAYQFYKKNPDQFPNKDYWTIIDFNRPSNEKRLFLIDMRTGEVERYYVAHGEASGTKTATEFSNKADSNKTSLGIYKTWGKNEFIPGVGTGIYISKRVGRALRVRGLEATNSHAQDRVILFHRAKTVKGLPYVSDEFIKEFGRAGRSLGCFALDPQYRDSIIDRIEGGSLVYAFHNQLLKN